MSAPPPAASPAKPVGPNIALVGSPNAGKTTLFNALTGLRAKTGNYPGVTVDRRVGTVPTDTGDASLIDLPGSYSLHAMSEDEAVAVRVLRGEMTGAERPDAAISLPTRPPSSAPCPCWQMSCCSSGPHCSP